MDKMTRNVTIIIAVVIAVGAVILAFFLTQNKLPKPAQSAPIETDEKVTLVSANVEHVKSMKVTNKHGSYTIVPYGEENENEEEGNFYTVEGMDFSKLEAYTIQNIVKYGSNPVSTNNLGNVENLQEYGLDDPIATVSVAYEDGEIYEYSIGERIDSKLSQYYMCAKDSHNVYVITLDPNMLGTTSNFYSKTIFDISQYKYVNKDDYDDVANGFSHITIENTNLPKEFVLEKLNRKEYKINDYTVVKPNYDTLDKIISNLEELKADEVVAIEANNEQLSQYGFNKPYAKITFIVNNKTYQLLLGNEDNGMRYAKIPETNVIYKLSNDKINDWANATLFTLTDTTIYAPDEIDFSSIEIKNEQKTDTITLNRVEDEKKSTESKIYYKYNAVLNGTDMEQKEFDAFITALQTAKVDEDTAAKAEGTPVLTITIKHFGSDQVDTISFYKKDNGVVVTLNDIVRGSMNNKNFSSFKNQMTLS